MKLLTLELEIIVNGAFKMAIITPCVKYRNSSNGVGIKVKIRATAKIAIHTNPFDRLKSSIPTETIHPNKGDTQRLKWSCFNIRFHR